MQLLLKYIDRKAIIKRKSPFRMCFWYTYKNGVYYYYYYIHIMLLNLSHTRIIMLQCIIVIHCWDKMKCDINLDIFPRIFRRVAKCACSVASYIKRGGMKCITHVYVRWDASFVYQNYRVRHSFGSGAALLQRCNSALLYTKREKERGRAEFWFPYGTHTAHPTKLIYTGFGDYQSLRTHLIYPTWGGSSTI